MFNTKSVSAESTLTTDTPKKQKSQFINCLIEKVHGVDFSSGWASFRVLKTGRSNPRNIFIDDFACFNKRPFAKTVDRFNLLFF